MPDYNPRGRRKRQGSLLAGVIPAAGLAGLGLAALPRSHAPSYAGWLPGQTGPTILRGNVQPGGVTTMDDTNKAFTLVGATSDLPTHLRGHVNPVHPEELSDYLGGLKARGLQLGPVAVDGHGSVIQTFGFNRGVPGAAAGAPRPGGQGREWLDVLRKHQPESIFLGGCQAGVCYGPGQPSPAERAAQITGVETSGSRGIAYGDYVEHGSGVRGFGWTDAHGKITGPGLLVARPGAPPEVRPAPTGETERAWPLLVARSGRGADLLEGAAEKVKGVSPWAAERLGSLSGHLREPKYQWPVTPTSTPLLDKLYQAAPYSSVAGAAAAPLMPSERLGLITALLGAAGTAPAVGQELYASALTGKTDNLLPRLAMPALPLASYGLARLLGRWAPRRKDEGRRKQSSPADRRKKPPGVLRDVAGAGLAALGLGGGAYLAGKAAPLAETVTGYDPRAEEAIGTLNQVGQSRTGAQAVARYVTGREALEGKSDAPAAFRRLLFQSADPTYGQSRDEQARAAAKDWPVLPRAPHTQWYAVDAPYQGWLSGAGPPADRRRAFESKYLDNLFPARQAGRPVPGLHGLNPEPALRAAAEQSALASVDRGPLMTPEAAGVTERLQALSKERDELLNLTSAEDIARTEQRLTDVKGEYNRLQASRPSVSSKGDYLKALGLSESAPAGPAAAAALAAGGGPLGAAAGLAASQLPMTPPSATSSRTPEDFLARMADTVRQGMAPGSDMPAATAERLAKAMDTPTGHLAALEVLHGHPVAAQAKQLADAAWWKHLPGRIGHQIAEAGPHLARWAPAAALGGAGLYGLYRLAESVRGKPPAQDVRSLAGRLSEHLRESTSAAADKARQWADLPDDDDTPPARKKRRPERQE